MPSAHSAGRARVALSRCYTHRVAISNHRLVALEDGDVVFRWRDSAHKNKKRLMRLTLDEFLRRFFLHVLPRGFVRIRHFGFFAHRRRAALLPLCFALWQRRLKHGRRQARRRRRLDGRCGSARSAEVRWQLQRDSQLPKRDCVPLPHEDNPYDLLFAISNCFSAGTPALELHTS
jgi:Putative transposase